MYKEPKRGQLVVYGVVPTDGRNWSLPEFGEVLRVIEVNHANLPEFPIQVHVETYVKNTNNFYSKYLKPQFLVLLEDVQREYLPSFKKETENCCWTCKYFSLAEECLKRRQEYNAFYNGILKTPCPKSSNGTNSGCLKCHGTVTRKGCERTSPCWERFPFGKRLKITKTPKGVLQANLIFPKCPTQ
jgi:hypothetical protein